MKIGIAFRVGSPSSTPYLVARTVRSFVDCLLGHELTFYISFGPHVSGESSSYLRTEDFPSASFILKTGEDVSWASFVNSRLSDLVGFDFVFISHDDVELKSSNFMKPILDLQVQSGSELGWIGFTDVDYLNMRPILSVRPGFHSDFLRSRKVGNLFQYHRLPEEWWFVPSNFGSKNLTRVRERWGLQQPFMTSASRLRMASNLDLDFPTSPVQVHSHFNHLVGIFPKALKRLGKCEDWGSPNALLVDEDWSLEATRRGFLNVWIPTLEYSHFRPRGGTRSQSQINAHRDQVHREFFLKWGFETPPSQEQVAAIPRIHSGTGLDWSIGRASFDWNYVAP